MSDVKHLPLNQGQQAAADGVFEFLFSTDRELIISGPGGVGKTFLMGYLIDEIIPRYQQTCKLMGIPIEYNDVMMTATTNKAADVLGVATGRPAQTIHSFMNLRVSDDYATGRSNLTKTRAWKIHSNLIIFVDESSMIDGPLLAMIREGTHKCKIIFVGDHCQLAPVMEPISPIYKQNLPFYELTKQERNNGQPALMDVCMQLRHTVETGEFLPIKIVPSVIDLLDGPDMEREIEEAFHEKVTNSRILAYTNARVIDYNDHIRDLRQLTATYTEGELLINNSAIQFRDSMLSVEAQVEIQNISPLTRMVEIEDGVQLEVRHCDLITVFGDKHENVPLPEDKEHFLSLIKYYSRKKDWHTYFKLKNTYPDLRARDASTVHKSQGSTYDTVFIDLGNLSTCHNPNLVARMLYVAFSRPRNRVVLYGNLVSKYGGLTH